MGEGLLLEEEARIEVIQPPSMTRGGALGTPLHPGLGHEGRVVGAQDQGARPARPSPPPILRRACRAGARHSESTEGPR